MHVRLQLLVAFRRLLGCMTASPLENISEQCADALHAECLCCRHFVPKDNSMRCCCETSRQRKFAGESGQVAPVGTRKIL
eukprot:1139970-Pelagomonas_calceolata.AAC.4